MRRYKTRSYKSSSSEQRLPTNSLCSRGRKPLCLSTPTSDGIGQFCVLMPFASNSALPCTATRARCFSMSTPNEARDLSSNHGNWARSWISPCTQTSEINPNSESQRERTTGYRSAPRRPTRVICTFRKISELNVATRRCCHSRVVGSWPPTPKDFVDRNFKWRRPKHRMCEQIIKQHQHFYIRFVAHRGKS